MSVDFTSVTPDMGEPPLEAARDGFAIGVALYLDFSFAAVLVTALCLLA
jgi:hypothetical protein